MSEKNKVEIEELHVTKMTSLGFSSGVGHPNKHRSSHLLMSQACDINLRFLIGRPVFIRG